MVPIEDSSDSPFTSSTIWSLLSFASLDFMLLPRFMMPITKSGASKTSSTVKAIIMSKLIFI